MGTKICDCGGIIIQIVECNIFLTNWPHCLVVMIGIVAFHPRT